MALKYYLGPHFPRVGYVEAINEWRDLRYVIKLESPVCDEKQAQYAIKDFISRCGMENKVEWFLNYGTKRDNSYDGFCLLWISGEGAPKVYRRLLNCDRYGFLRLEAKDEATEYKIICEYEKRTKGLSGFQFATEDEIAFDVYDKYESALAPQKPVTEPPRFFLTHNQRRLLNTDEKFAHFKASPIRLEDKSVPKDRYGKTLFAQRIHPKLDINYIHSNLKRMCTSGYRLNEIQNRSGRCITIQFELKNDSILFRTMFRKVIIPMGKQPGVIIFNYAFKYNK